MPRPLLALLALLFVAIVGAAAAPGPAGSARHSIVVALSAERAIPGATVTAVARDSADSARSLGAVVWSSSNPRVASVSREGEVRARSYGEATIIARVRRQTGRATLRVRGGVFEPEGMTRITDRAFSAGIEDWDPIEADRAKNMRFVADSTAPRSPSGVLTLLYPAGFVGGVSPGVAQKAFTVAGYGTIYSSFWVRFSDNFHGHRTSVNKIFYWWIGGGARLFVLGEGRDERPLSAAMSMQGVADRRRRLRPNLVPDARFVRGRWHHVEVLLRPNTVGNADGVVEWWLDGVPVGSFRDLRMLYDYETRRVWNAIQLAPVWGGGIDTVYVEQALSLDHVYVSGAK